MSDFIEENEQLLSDKQLAEINKKAEEVKLANPKVKKIIPIVVMGDEGDDKEFYVGYFKQPPFVAFSKYMNIVQKDSVGAMRELAKDCFVAGDEELIKDESLFLFGLMTQLSSIIEVRKGQLVNLSKAGK